MKRRRRAKNGPKRGRGRGIENVCVCVWHATCHLPLLLSISLIYGAQNNEVIFVFFILRALAPLVNGRNISKKKKNERKQKLVFRLICYNDIFINSAAKKSESKLSHIEMLRFCVRTFISTLQSPIKCESISGGFSWWTSQFIFGIPFMRWIPNRIIEHFPSDDTVSATAAFQ